MRNLKRRREPLLASGDLALIFDVTVDTVAGWAKTGKIRSIRTPGGKYRFREADVEALLADGFDEQTDALEDAEPITRPVLVGQPAPDSTGEAQS